MTRRLLAPLALGLLALFAACVYSAVDNRLSDEDRQYLHKMMAEAALAPLPPGADTGTQLAFVIGAQRAVQQLAPINRGLPLGQPREPKDLYLARYGLCYDRSRVLEKLLRLNGLETRHVALFSLREDGPLGFFLTRRLPSHAVSEVRTAGGWLLVDSNVPWVSLGHDGAPVALAELLRSGGQPVGGWDPRFAQMPAFYREPLLAVYGLYARHGYFYPPYNPLPDIHWGELWQNL